MESRDRIEFHIGTVGLVGVRSCMVPPPGSLISIMGKTYKVLDVTYALDYAVDPLERRMRANVDIEPLLKSRKKR